jgi:hypothetical protein
MYMGDWKAKLDGFLQFNGRDVLNNPGTVSAEVAKRLAEAQYEKFSARRLQIEDEQSGGEFDEAVKRIENKRGK